MATPKLPRLAVASPTGSDGTSNKIQNLILLGLPADELTAATRKLQFVELPTHTVLHEAGEPLTHAYFINSGLASVLSVMTDGKSVEVGLAGKEGFIGLPLVVGLSSSPTQVIMQVGGSAYQLAAADLKELLSRSPTLEKSLNRYAQSIAMQATHVAACNRLHEVDERLARWLLMSQDRLGGDIVPLTQEFLAHMLGTRRASVTVAAGILQKAGLITYNRGSVRIDNRSGLEDASCECYASIKLQTEKWEKELARVGTLPR
ncbi:MAG: Crp/Fnr family transcriptional regulator [Candidatus Acidiferrales bacterium]